MKLLVVDDDAKIARALQRGLSAEGFAVEIAEDGIEGLWRATEGSYDLILLDIMLPGRNGYRVCADLRRAGNTTPILMLTAKDGDLDEAEGLDTGADDYLRKPFSFPVLVARVHALLRRAALGEPPPLVAGELSLDLPARRARSGGNDVPLTAREFDLLTYLVRRAGHVVTKREILAGVWDDDFAGDPNVVEVYVARLRRKLDGASGRSSIETRARRRLPHPADMTTGGLRAVQGTLRARVTAVAVLAVLVVLSLTSVGVVLAQRNALVDALDETLDQRADDLAVLVRSGQQPTDRDLEFDDVVVQVVAADGRVLAASPDLQGDLPRNASPATVELPGSAEPARLHVRDVEGTTILVAGTLDDVRDSTVALAGSLLLAVPVSTAVLASVVWWAVGRALRPVEAIRLRVEQITGTASGQRVPEPRHAVRARPPGPHHERDARPAAGVGRAAAPVRRRRLPRAPQPAGPHARRARGRPGASRLRRPGSHVGERARRDDPAPAAGGRPAAAGAGRRRGSGRRAGASRGPRRRRGTAGRGAPRSTSHRSTPGTWRRSSWQPTRPSWGAPWATCSTTPSATHAAPSWSRWPSATGTPS